MTNTKRINSRRKGCNGEREIAKILRGYGYDARRGQQYSGANGDADVVGLPGVHIEVKRVEALNIDKAMEQAERDARPGEIPAVFHRKNGKSWNVTLGLEDFMKLYEAAEAFRRLADEQIDYMEDVCDFMRFEGDYCATNCHATRDGKDCYIDYVRALRRAG